ncbi:MAG: hypothetical protein KAT90_14890 [Gammaproteobacteria bacterium]|nr:hypothetical protein [Gammaproteobacteria bacterium]
MIKKIYLTKETDKATGESVYFAKRDGKTSKTSQIEHDYLKTWCQGTGGCRVTDFKSEELENMIIKTCICHVAQ